MCSRKAARQAHPDKGGSEAKMAAVNEAYEVLSDPGAYTPSIPYSARLMPRPAELRQRYDNGDDPNDPTTQQGGNPFTGGFPAGQFAQFFQQGFGGHGGFQFKYSAPGFH